VSGREAVRTEQELGSLALAAFFATACSGWGRVDFMRDRAGRPWLLEVNTAPGMTSHSLVPKAARKRGIEFDELVWRVLETSVPAQPGEGRDAVLEEAQSPPAAQGRSPRCSSASTGARSATPRDWLRSVPSWPCCWCWRSTAPVQRVIIEGSFQRVARPEIERPSSRVVQGGLASVDLVQVRERIEQIRLGGSRRRAAPLARRAARSLVTEQVAAAQWNDAGLLNTRGELFLRNARYVPPELPLLEGPEGSEAWSRTLSRRAGRLLEAGLRLTGREARRARRMGSCGSTAASR